MQPSMFNVRVPLAAVNNRDEVFLMNTFTDAQLIVSPDVAGLLDRISGAESVSAFTEAEREALSTLTEHGFVVPDRAVERQQLEQFFRDVRESKEQLRITVLTTLQCNFACDYCIQGDHGDYNKTATKMSLETAARVADWTESRLDAITPENLSITFFGGEPLLNMPVIYYLAERLWSACQARGVRMLINVITNGLLLTPEMVDRLNAFGLNGVKITLDGDQHTHDRMRPLRGGQGTFDKIIGNIRKIAGKTKIQIGGNFDESSVDSYPALLEFLREQDFADQLLRVSFKPIIAPPKPQAPKGMIPLTVVGAQNNGIGGACMTSAGSGASKPKSGCDNCDFASEKMSFLREETKKAGFATSDGVHMGPCEIHKDNAHTIGTDGGIFACPGFAADATQATGHIDGRVDPGRQRAASRFAKIAAWKGCNDCAFIPVCAGGCSTAAHAELGDMNEPNCFKASFEAGVLSLARDAAAAEFGLTVN
jgi:uncharacterized protein